ncbi:hypothetical protein L7F22_019426 [Adiantum nelumboides]|nr:hypothetical protein [Adiantum nelumboides]
MDTDLIKVVNKLQETFSAVGGDQVDLPQCVVVGSQSSGKSSVLENHCWKRFPSTWKWYRHTSSTRPSTCSYTVGDQPSDIERQIHSLVTSYISKPNCIIIAVSPANVDLANSDSLKLARAIDPQGRRTIGVLTKLDLMDNGTHALDILTGRVYPLKLGFIGVVNRSQQDINGNKSMLAARKAEEDFFNNHAAYRNIAHRCGTKYLAKTLNQVLLAHIKDRLPDMKARLQTLMTQTQQELASFGDTALMGETHRGSLVLKLMTQFARDFVNSIDGKTLEASTKELCGGARIYFIFNDVFGSALEDLPQLHELRTSTLPRLHSQIIEVVSELLRERLGPTSDYVQSLIAIQAAYINTNHPAFVQDSANIARQTREGHQRHGPALLKGPRSRRGSMDSDEYSGAKVVEEDEDDSGFKETNRSLAVNGNSYTKANGRSENHSKAASNGRNTNAASVPMQQTASGSRTSQETGKDSFLTYFFGGANGLPGTTTNTTAAGLGQRSSLFADSKQNDIIAQGSTAAYSMRSLEKHLEATPLTSDELTLTDREVLETSLIRSLIGSYFGIVRQSIQDLIPKAVMHLLVDNCRESIQNRLVSTLFKDSLFDTLLEEDPALTGERKRVASLLDAYRKAFEVLSEVNFRP